MKLFHSFALIGTFVAFYVAGSDVSLSATNAGWSSAPTSSSAVVLESPTTAALPWLTQDGATGGVVPGDGPESTAPTWDNSCSTGATGETCSTGNGGGADGYCSTEGGVSNQSQCSARAMSGGNGGRCSASVDGGGATGESCSTQGGGFGFCSVMGGDGQAACSATGRATCSTNASFGFCTTHGTSGSQTSCSVTEGSGGSCTAGTSSGGRCSTTSGGMGICSSWTAGGGMVDDGDRVDICQG